MTQVVRALRKDLICHLLFAWLVINRIAGIIDNLALTLIFSHDQLKGLFVLHQRYPFNWLNGLWFISYFEEIFIYWYFSIELKYWLIQTMSPSTY